MLPKETDFYKKNTKKSVHELQISLQKFRQDPIIHLPLFKVFETVMIGDVVYEHDCVGSENVLVEHFTLLGITTNIPQLKKVA